MPKENLDIHQQQKRFTRTDAFDEAVQGLDREKDPGRLRVVGDGTMHLGRACPLLIGREIAAELAKNLIIWTAKQFRTQRLTAIDDPLEVIDGPLAVAGIG